MSKGPTSTRSVKELEWVGWNRIKELVEKTYSVEFEYGDQEFKRKYARGLILVGFKTGGRISEILNIRADDFSFDGEFWTITLPLEKRYNQTEAEVRKWKCERCNRRWMDKPTEIINRSAAEPLLSCSNGGYHKVTDYVGYETEKLFESRDIEFHSSEPLNEELKEYVLSCDNRLFPHPYHPEKPMKRAYAYTLINETDDEIWPHWLRAQRACQLADELGFDLEARQEWFKWEGQKYARLYGSKKYELREMWRDPVRRIK